jgi:hypothetical protein
MNSAAFGGLTDARRALLVRAGREALEPALGRVARDEEIALSELCAGGKAWFATATDAEVQSLREAVQPVYDELERDARTKRWIAELAAARPARPRPALRCDGKRARDLADTSRLEGRWRVHWTRNELLRAGLRPADAEALEGTFVVEFANGLLSTASGRTRGTYSVTGPVVRLVFDSGAAVDPGRTYQLKWSVYRDSLSFSAVPGREPVSFLGIKALTRVR